MLQCVAVRCSALQCVAVCCNALQCVAVCCNVLMMSSSMSASVQICVSCNVCSVLQFDLVYWCVLECVAGRYIRTYIHICIHVRVGMSVLLNMRVWCVSVH